jgi:hypothetical protein
MSLNFQARRLLYVVVYGCLLTMPCLAQSPKTAMDAYNYVQQQRREAEKLWNAKPASREDIEKAIKILEESLTGNWWKQRSTVVLYVTGRRSISSLHKT